MDGNWWLGLLLLVGGLFALARYGRALLHGAALLLGLAAVLALAWAWGAQANATQQVAAAATVSAAGQTANSIAVSILATVLGVALLAGAGLSGYLWLRLRRAEQRASNPGRWRPGPNAQWGRADTLSPTVDPVAQLVQLEVLRTLRELRSPTPYAALTPPALPVAEEEDDAQPYTWPW